MPAKGYRAPRMPRFMAMVQRSPDGHWMWTGSLSRGYGLFSWGGRNSSMHAHRAAWKLFRGEIPDGHQVHHICHVRGCVNPDHLEVVTLQEHATVRHAMGTRPRIAVCKHGHPMEGENIGWTTQHTARYPDGYLARICKACALESQRALRASGYIKPSRRK